MPRGTGKGPVGSLPAPAALPGDEGGRSTGRGHTTPRLLATWSRWVWSEESETPAPAG